MSLSQHPRRIVTRPDFDGIVCAVIIRCAEGVDLPLLWVEPSEVQKGRVEIESGDILANLPYDARCLMWFDHHDSNQPRHGYKGLFRLAPSAAGLVYEYYRDQLDVDFDALVRQTDCIDSADLTRDQVLYPQKYPHVLLSMTIANRNTADRPYWEQLVSLLMNQPIESVMTNPEVRKRCAQTIEQNNAYRGILETYTEMVGGVAITDLRELTPAPNGNRFLVYSLFPEGYVQVKIRYDYRQADMVIISVGHSIFHRACKVNVGRMLSAVGGGGHPGAGACRIMADEAPQVIAHIVQVLQENQPN